MKNGFMPGEKAFLMMLYRMAYPRRLVDMEDFVGREYSTISRCFNFVVKLMDVEDGHLLLDSLEFFLLKFPNYNRVILDKIAIANDNLIPDRERMVTGFLDGTKREICHPFGNDNIQRAVYDGRLHEHNLGFQGVFLTHVLSLTHILTLTHALSLNHTMSAGLSAPDGLLMDLFGPIAGRYHDMIMVQESGINGKFRDVQIGQEAQYVMYTDKGYADRTHLLAAYHGAELTLPQMQINGVMTLLRVAVEWCFGKITECQKYIDFAQGQQMQLQPVAKYYRLAALLMNAHSCLYGNQTSIHFGLKPPSLRVYFDCADRIPV